MAEPSSTPLEILLNAITGSSPSNLYDFTDDDAAQLPGPAPGTAPGAGVAGTGPSSRSIAHPGTEPREGLGAVDEDDELAERELMELTGLFDESGYKVPLSPTALTGTSAVRGAGDDWRDDTSIRRTITELLLAPDEMSGAATRRMNSIQVWHPTAGQKSYGKERRLLAPPPFIQASGPLVSHLSGVTLSTLPETSIHPMSSQTHTISSLPLTTSPTVSSLATSGAIDTSAGLVPAGKKRGRVANEAKRQMRASASRSGFAGTLPHQRKLMAEQDQERLAQGVSFPGLWVAQPAASEQEDSDPAGRGRRKEKGFRLALDLSTASQSPPSDQAAKSGSGIDGSAAPAALGAALDAPSSPWTTLVSTDLTIITKPSQKTAKARTLETCLAETASFALWVRINAQTVRTKYMKLDTAGPRRRLTSRTGQWTPFRFEVIRRPRLSDVGPDLFRQRMMRQGDVGSQWGPGRGGERDTNDEERERGAGILRYGAVVRLVDLQSGIKSELAKLVKVDKNEVIVGLDEGHPVSELQRIALVRVQQDGEAYVDVIGPDGGRMYLAAPGARLGGGELRDANEVNEMTEKRSGKRRALSHAKVTDGGMTDESRAIALTAAPDLSTSTTAPPETLEASLANLTNFDLPDFGGMAPLDDAVFADINFKPETDFILPKELTRDNVLAPPAVHDAAGNDKSMDVVGADEPIEGGSAGRPLDSKEDARPKKRLKTKRDALAAAAVAEESDTSGQMALVWRPAARQEAARNIDTGKISVMRNVDVEHVHDEMAWVIAGVGHFGCTFHDPTRAALLDTPSASPTAIPSPPGIIPYILTEPALHTHIDQSNRIHTLLELTLSDFFIRDAAASPLALEVYIGPIGPLQIGTYLSTFTKDPTRDAPTTVQPYDGKVVGDLYTSSHLDPPHQIPLVTSSFPSRVNHVIVVAQLPSVQEIREVSEALARQRGAKTDLRSSDRSYVPIRPAPASSSIVSSTAPATLDNTSSIAPFIDDSAAWLGSAAAPLGGELGDGDIDGNEAIRQAIQNVSRAAEAEAARSKAANNESVGMEGMVGVPVESTEAALDPSLRPATMGLGRNAEQETMNTGSHGTGVMPDPTRTALSTQERNEVELLDSDASQIRDGDVAMTSTGVGGDTGLPIYLVKRHGGVVFAIGRNVFVVDGQIRVGMARS